MTMTRDDDRLLSHLSVPAEVHQPGREGISRRRFIQGTLAAGAATVGNVAWAGEAFASPIAPTDGVLVMVMLAGGNDGLDALAPISGSDRARYEALRPSIALPARELLPAADGYGFNPRLGRLASRFDAGTVAVVRGVGSPRADLSHFSSMASCMAGTASSSRTTGWLGRFLDGLTEHDSGLRGVTFSPGVPLHLLGARAKVTALPALGRLWGADRTERWERSAHDAVRAYAGRPIGRGPWGERIATGGSTALDMADTVSPLFRPELRSAGLVRDLTLAARLVNANLGTRVIGVGRSGFDTHAAQRGVHDELLDELDAGIDAFFQALAPTVRSQVTLATFSEFGRHPRSNGSLGTDHGTAGLSFVVGERVNGGLHGAMPSLAQLGPDDHLVPTVDHRSVYATLLDDWLGADPTEVLGSPFPRLPLFAGSPG
jgi:uncharacterized protein (DUF1501 family)